MKNRDYQYVTFEPAETVKYRPSFTRTIKDSKKQKRLRRWRGSVLRPTQGRRWALVETMNDATISGRTLSVERVELDVNLLQKV